MCYTTISHTPLTPASAKLANHVPADALALSELEFEELSCPIASKPLNLRQHSALVQPNALVGWHAREPAENTECPRLPHALIRHPAKLIPSIYIVE